MEARPFFFFIQNKIGQLTYDTLRLAVVGRVVVQGCNPQLSSPFQVPCSEHDPYPPGHTG